MSKNWNDLSWTWCSQLIHECVGPLKPRLHDSQKRIYNNVKLDDLFAVNCEISKLFYSNSRVFPKLTDLTFLSFLYKIDITGFQNQQKKIIASTGYWTHNTNPTIRIPATLTTQPPRHLLNRISLNWTWIISGSIEHDFIWVWKFETGMDWQIGWVGKVAGILIVLSGGNFFSRFWNPVMSILYKNERNVRSVNLGKTRVFCIEETNPLYAHDRRPNEQY